MILFSHVDWTRELDSMTCFSPLQAFQGLRDGTPNGKPFFLRKRYSDVPIKLPCNRCSGCRLSYSREWAIRCMHEASLNEANCFITLTYNDHFLPRIYSEDARLLGTGTLNYQHWTNFMKRFRENLTSESFMSRFGLPVYEGKVRFYMGPEYGDLNLRPHYHALIFNYDFPDKFLYLERNGHRLYRSPLLEALWIDTDSGSSLGYSTVGSCTYQSAAYVARYMMKKVKGEDIDRRYERFNLETGEVFYVLPETARMSNRSGIGKEWFDQFAFSDCYNKDFVTMNGVKFRPPKYYDSQLKLISLKDYEDIKSSRQLAMAKSAGDLTPERLAVREKCQLAKLNLLQRNLSKELSNVT